MVRGLGGGEGIEFEGQVGMAGGDQFVIHLLPRHAEMAGEAGLGADLQILGVDHAGLDAGLVRILAGVRAEPLFGGAVTGFAGHAVGARLFGRARDMADGAALVARGVGDAEDLRHAFAARFHQGFEGAGVFVGDAPVWRTHCPGCGSRRRASAVVAPWQLEEAQPPTPIYPCGAGCASANPAIATSIRASLISGSLQNQNHDQCDGKQHGDRNRNVQRPGAWFSLGYAAVENGVWQRSHSVAWGGFAKVHEGQ